MVGERSLPTDWGGMFAVLVTFIQFFLYKGSSILHSRCVN